MGVIHVLSPQMANLIAAGEVVERPGSVVKEIIENSIDAGADHIEVEIKNGGVTYIRVTDNGKGIEPDDLPRAFLRHATSKIREPKDMAAIGTMGFRGEALAAISAVAKVDIFSRTAQSISGVQMTCEGGEAGTPAETGCPQGTTVIIRDLFYNVPARMKFLKKDATEGAYCESAVQSAALANPGISFRFIKDGRESFFTPGSGDFLQAISAVCGKSVAAAMIHVQGMFPDVEIDGYVSPIEENRASRSMQYFLVNGRPVKGKTLSAAVDSAYKGRIMPGRHPVCFLNIHVPLSAVDVNVHPAKLEVKFAQEKAVFSAIHNAITLALDGAVGFPQVRLESEKTEPTKPALRKEEVRKEENPFIPVPKPDVKHKIDPYMGLRIEIDEEGHLVAEERDIPLHLHSVGAQYPAADPPPPPAPAPRKMERAPESQLFDLDDSMFGIDSRQLVPPKKSSSSGSGFNRINGRPVTPSVSAEEMRAIFGLASIPAEKPKPAEEPQSWAPQQKVAAPVAEEDLLPEVGRSEIRVIGMVFQTYILAQEDDILWMIDKHAAHERIIYNELKGRIGAQDMQTLLTPVSVRLTPGEKQACLDNAELLEKCGFEVDDLGLSGLAVRGAPTYLQEQDIPFVLSEMAAKLASGFDAESSILDDLLASISCKAAIKGGSHSDPIELEHLAKRVLSMPDVRNCPHGRPVAVSMSRKQMEKQFKRIL